MSTPYARSGVLPTARPMTPSFADAVGIGIRRKERRIPRWRLRLMKLLALALIVAAIFLWSSAFVIVLVGEKDLASSTIAIGAIAAIVAAGIWHRYNRYRPLYKRKF